MTKQICFLLAAFMAITCLTGCAPKAAVSQPTMDMKPEPAKETIVSVKEELQSNGSTLTIDTEVTVPDLSALEEITLVFDEAALDKMVEELVHSQYPGLDEGTMDGYRSWSVQTPEQLLFSFDCIDDGFDAGWTGYLDVARNLNGQDMGDDELARWTPHYMTPYIPDKLEITSAEAGDTIASFLEQYSCFDYKPWNIVGCNCRSIPDSSGYYQAQMQPYYNGLPVFMDQIPLVGACLSAEGIFEFQGILALTEHSRNTAEINMTLQEAVELFKSDFADNPRGDSATVNRIFAGYIAESYYDETRVLFPAWFFEYSYSETHPNTGEEMIIHSTSMYRMDNGGLYTFH